MNKIRRLWVVRLLAKAGLWVACSLGKAGYQAARLFERAGLWVAGLPEKAELWMEGSLFFRAVLSVMNFLQRLCEGSFIVGLMSAPYEEKRLHNSLFVRGAERLLNISPVQVKAPEAWPRGLANGLSGSALVRTVCNGLDTPIPAARLGEGMGRVLQWLVYAAPLWGLLLITAGAPVLPTMSLAGVLVAVAGFTLFTRRYIVDLTTSFILLFILVTLFCGVASFAPSSSIPIALLTSVLMFAYPAVLACLRKRTQIDFFFFAFSASAGVTGMIGLYQFVTKKVDLTWVDVDMFTDILFRAYSSFGNPNVFGTYLLLAIPLCAALVLYVKKPLYKLYAIALTLLLLFNLYKTYSRGCYLALALAAFVFVLMMEKRLIVLFFAGLMAVPFVLPPTMLNRLMSIATPMADSSTTYRVFIWQGTLRVLKDYWMVGLGQGIDAYNVVYPYYAFNSIIAPHSHNLFLQVFVETGIVGLLVFLGVLACFYRVMINALRRVTAARDRVMMVAMVAAVTGFLFQGIFDYVFYNYKVMLAFFLFMGLGAAFARVAAAGAAHD